MTDNTVSLKEIWSVVSTLSSDAMQWLTLLDNTPEADEKGQSFCRRMLLRTSVAVIESISYRLILQASVVGSGEKADFIRGELAKFYNFDAEGHATATPGGSGMLQAIRFSFTAYAAAHHSEYSLSTPDENWPVIDEIAQLHERLVAPEAIEDLEISDEDVVTISVGLAWFLKRWHELLFSCGHALIESTPLQGPIM